MEGAVSLVVRVLYEPWLKKGDTAGFFYNLGPEASSPCLGYGVGCQACLGWRNDWILRAG